MTDYKDEYLCEMKRADAAEDALAALRAELDAMRAAVAWRPGTHSPSQDGLYLYSYGESAIDVNRYSAAAGWHCARVPTRWLPIPPIGDGRQDTPGVTPATPWPTWGAATGEAWATYEAVWTEAKKVER